MEEIRKQVGFPIIELTAVVTDMELEVEHPIDGLTGFTEAESLEHLNG